VKVSRDIAYTYDENSQSLRNSDLQRANVYC